MSKTGAAVVKTEDSGVVIGSVGLETAGYSSQHEGEVADLWNKTKARKFSSILCTHTYIVM